MGVVRPRVSFAELQQFPDDGRRYELYDGELIVVPAPILLHQRVALRVYDVLHEYEQTHGGLVVVAPIDVVLSAHTVLQPDVVFVVRERRHLLDMSQAIHVAPDLAVEVLSPSTSSRDRGRKMEIYAREGVCEYWLVDAAARTIEIYSPHEGAWMLIGRGRPGQALASAALTGLRFDAGRIFEI